MLLASWNVYKIETGFRSLNGKNFDSIGQRAAKLLAVKVRVLLFSKSILQAQEVGSMLGMSFARSKWPHFHRAYLGTICKPRATAVSLQF